MPAEPRPARLLNPTTAPRFEPRPKNLSIEITRRCQLQCRHCYNESGPDRRDELDKKTIERLLDELPPPGLEQLRITGGEPTCHPDFAGILHACNDRGLPVILHSHGIYSPRLLERLCTAPVTRFMIGFDGLQSHHEAVRGKGTFARAVLGCRALTAARQAVTLAFHASRPNRRDLAGLADLAAALGADLKVSPMRQIGRAAKEMPSETLRAQDALDMARGVVGLRRRYKQIRLFADFDILDETPEPYAITDSNLACGAGRVMAHVAATGDVYPCSFFAGPDRELSAGNIHERPLLDIWQAASPAFQPFRIHSKSAVCQGCRHYRRWCAGGCPAIAFAATGALDAMDPTCFIPLIDGRDPSP